MKYAHKIYSWQGQHYFIQYADQHTTEWRREAFPDNPNERETDLNFGIIQQYSGMSIPGNVVYYWPVPWIVVGGFIVAAYLWFKIRMAVK